jgi:hypothetical protein
MPLRARGNTKAYLSCKSIPHGFADFSFTKVAKVFRRCGWAHPQSSLNRGNVTRQDAVSGSCNARKFVSPLASHRSRHAQEEERPREFRARPPDALGVKQGFKKATAE